MPWAGAVRRRVVGGASLGHLEDGRSNGRLFCPVIGHDGDRQAGLPKTINRVGEYCLNRSARGHPRRQLPVPSRSVLPIG
eukprot:9041824-Alexandrium_andersonii.AAC.1